MRWSSDDDDADDGHEMMFMEVDGDYDKHRCNSALYAHLAPSSEYRKSAKSITLNTKQ